MEYRISDRMAALKPSAIREILKNTANPNVIPFAAGNPSPDAFPVKEISKISSIVLENSAVAALQYSVSEGYAPLRTAVDNFCEAQEPGLKDNDLDDTLIVTGGQQGIDLTAKCLLNEGDIVICEDPSFIGALNTFRSYNVKLMGVPLESDGISIEGVEAILKEYPRTKLIYLIPNFQNPGGCTMSLAKRKAVYELAKKYGAIILEDNPYGALRYENEHIPAIKTLDTTGNVVYCASFSKIISPGFRVGYLVARKELMQKLVVAKQCSDVHTPMLTQMISQQFLSTCNIDAHISSMIRLYRTKRDLMCSMIDTYFGDKITYVRPEGGLFVWCTMPCGSDMIGFVKAALEKNVAVVPGNAFCADPSAQSFSFRMNFSTPTATQITDGMEILGDVLKNFVK